MGIEFIRLRSKPHKKLQTTEFLRASGDLLVDADTPNGRSLVFHASVTGDIENLSPDTKILLKAEGDHLDCYLGGRLIATVENPPASWVAAVSEQPEGYCAGSIEERHRDIGKVTIRITV